MEIVIGGVRNHGAKANGQREEDLGNSCIPHQRIEQLPPLWLEEVHNAGPGAGQRHGTQQQHQQHHIRKHAQKVGSLAAALDATYEYGANDEPGHSQAADELPIGHAHTIIQVGQLMENFTSV